LDDTYQVYVNRLAQMTARDAYKTNGYHIQSSVKYHRADDGTWQPTPFPGYTVITPPWEARPDGPNQDFYQRLKTCQAELIQQLPPNLCIPVPPGSFHLTLADLIWDDAYRHAQADPAYEDKLRQCVAHCFQRSQSSLTSHAPITWQSLGLILMPRAVGIGLVPKNEASYNSICTLRRQLYQNSELMSLGIEQQYHFTAHITLGYFGDTTPIKEQPDPMAEQISQILTDLNTLWLDADPIPHFDITQIQFRQFPDMTRYQRAEDWPAIEL
jgi:hypothetical protein